MPSESPPDAMTQRSLVPPAFYQSQRWRSHWNLFLSLVSRDIRARYRRTLLGPLWAIIPAIMSTAIFSFLNRVISIDTDGAPYLVFVFAATVPWTFFQSSVTRTPYGVLSNGSILTKMAVPRIIFPLVIIATTFFDFLMSSLVLLAVLLLYGMPVTAAWLWLLPLVIMLALLAFAVGIGITSFTIYRRDMLHGIGHIMQVWLFLTPVIYSAGELESNLRIIYLLNPMVGIIGGFREVLVFGNPPDPGLLLISFVIMLASLAVALPLYQTMSRYFADVL